MKSEIIAIGSEMLTPFRQDTNSLHLTEKLNDLGVTVAFKTIVGDRRKDLTNAIRVALGRTDIVVITGGLGPTEDDLTREAVAEALSLSLRRDAAQVSALAARTAAWRLPMPPNNLKQADVLEGATLLPNPNGSAPGQWLDTVVDGHRKIVILLPGPPREIKPLFTDVCEPLLAANLPERHFAKRMLRIALMPESKVDAIAAPIYQTYTDVESTILSSGAEIQLHFLCIKPTMAEAQQRVDELTSKVEDVLDEAVFSAHGEPLEEIVLLRLQMRGLTLATAESITGGMVATRLTSIAGASDTYVGGAVVYSPHLKKKFASVPDDILKKFGTVSEEAARSLAEGIRKETNSSIGLAVTGVAGPGPMMDTDNTEKPCGLVYVAVSDGISTESLKKTFTGDRERIRAYAAQQTLDILRHKLI